MSRIAWLLTSLVLILVAVGWWFLLWQPTSDDIEQVRLDTDSTLVQAERQRSEAARLRTVRETAPELEAELAVARVVVPDDAALPALLRQVQQASDDAGVRLLSVAPGRPAEVGAVPGLSQVSMALNVEGTYFQLIDLARRLEDPAITGRGLTWNSATFSPQEFPVLIASLSATVYTRTPAVDEPPPPEPDQTATDPDAGDAPVGDLDEDVVIE